MLDLDCVTDFDPTLEDLFFASLPTRPGVVLVEMRSSDAEPFLLRTADVRRAGERLLGPKDPSSRRLNLREVAAGVRYRIVGSKFEQSLTYYQQARVFLPARYKELARIRPPAVLKVNLRSEYPRCYVTRRVHGDFGFYFGPFVSRKAADAFGEAFLDLFKLRRCQIKIRRDPSFPGCIYSEMKMCLAPCFAGCTKEEYHAEVARVLETLASSGSWLIQDVEREREAASEVLDFEHAAALHKRLEKIEGVFRSLPELPRKIDDLNLVILQRGAEEKMVVVFPVLRGMLREPISLRFAASSEPKSVETTLRAGLEMTVDLHGTAAAGLVEEGSGPSGTGKENNDDLRRRFGLREAAPELGEHLCLIARWFYSNPREGEIFFREGDWPYRRILRACGRLLTVAASSDNTGPQLSGEQRAALARERIKRLKSFSKRRPKPKK